MPAIILVGVGGEGIFTPQILCCLELFCYRAQAHYLLQKAKLAGREYEAEKLFCCVGPVIKQGFLNHGVAPQVINNFSHPGVYILLVAEWVSQSHCPSSEAAHPWSFLSYCSFQSWMCSVALLWTLVPVILLELRHLETNVVLLELPSSTTQKGLKVCDSSLLPVTLCFVSNSIGFIFEPYNVEISRWVFWKIKYFFSSPQTITEFCVNDSVGI